MEGRKRIAILVGQADEYYQAEFICGFEKQAFTYNWDVLIFSTYQKYQSSALREQGETAIFSLVPYEELDGLVLMLDTLQTPGLADAIEEAAHKRARCPVICIDKKSKYFFSAFPNHYAGVKHLVTHLIEEHGHTDIAFLTGKAWHPYSKERMQAYKDAMAEHGLEIRSDRLYYGDFWYTSGESVGDRIAKNPDDLPDAIACANDCMAIGVCKALTENGIRVPEDVAVVGYDSNEEGRLSPMPITSVKLPAQAFGKYAAETIYSMNKGGEPQPFSCPIELFHGSSCGCELRVEETRLALRPVWDTNTSSNSIFSNFNHLDDDLLTQKTLYGIISTLFTYVYQLREFESFNICINDDWSHYGLVSGDKDGGDNAKSISEPIDTQINTEFLSDPSRFFSAKMADVMTCRPEKLNCDRIGLDYYFNRDRLIPRLDEDRPNPEAFIFSPLHFDHMCFGYAAVSYSEPSSYGDSYRLWLRSLMRGLEITRRIEELAKKNESLESNLIRDPVTGLYNYRGFTQQVDGLLFKFKGIGKPDVGVLAADIRNLSEINDKDGRSAGDRAIIKLGKLIQETFPEGNVYSFGNGEIIVVDALAEDGKKRFEDAVVDIRQKLNEFTNSKKYTIPVDIYYGYADGNPEDRNEFERITSVALTNKNAYKLRIRSLYGEESGDDGERQADQVIDILDQNKIKYHFQPIIDAHTGEVYAYEALMRVDSIPYIQPPVVLKFAELFGRLYDVEAATFNNILNIIDTRTDEFREGAKVFINSIPGQRLKGKDMDNLINVTQRHKDMVVVEFTEETELSDEDLASLKQFCESLGIELAIDDYGTGYSNVSNLFRYMPRYIKIDRSLISEIHMSPHKQHFVKDIIGFAHDNSIMALAEGVETQEELATLVFLGIDLIQGYYTARPSEKIVKEIDPEAKAAILRYARLEIEERNKNIYVAGRESRIQLQNLIGNGCKGIRITNGKVTYKDVTITGVPGVPSDICLTVEDGYAGRIALENACFSGKKKKAAIIIGENCDVTLVLKGENNLENGGIVVPETSTLTFEGEGNLNVSITGTEGFGIGNDNDSKAGKLIFDQDGSIEIIFGVTKGVCIGAGKGVSIDIRRGRYFIRMQGTEGTAFGTLTGDVKMSVVNCAIDLNANVMTSVGIGSLYGSPDVKIEHISYNSTFNGNDISVIGTVKGERSDVNLYSASLQTRFTSSRGLMFGALNCAPSVVNLDYATIKLECEGKQVSVFRGTDKNSKLVLTNSHIDGKMVSGMTVPCKLDDMDFTIAKSGATIYVNGEALYDGTY